jgi:transcriptional regulator of acetoin/glycerol metabolism
VITANELPPEVARLNGSMPYMPLPAAAVPGMPAPEVMSAGGNTGSLRDVEKQQIIAALEKVGWHRGKAAEILGISPSTLYRRLRDYNLEGRLR